MDGDATEPKATAVSPLEQVTAFRQAAAAASRTWRKAASTVRRLDSDEALDDPVGVRRTAAQLAKLDLAEARALSAELTAHAERCAEERKFRLAGEVVEGLRAAGADPRRVGDQPPSWRAGRLVVTLDPFRGRATIEYARESLAQVPPAPSRIVEAWREVGERLARQAVPPDRFRDLLLASYRALLARRNLPFGDRVDAVDLLPEVALAVQGEAFRTNPQRATFSDYPRAQFAYDLAVLVESGLLGAGDLRLDMGPATMGSTARKRRVLWVETSAGAGQYYLSLRFVPAAAGRDG